MPCSFQSSRRTERLAGVCWAIPCIKYAENSVVCQVYYCPLLAQSNGELKTSVRRRLPTVGWRPPAEHRAAQKTGAAPRTQPAPSVTRNRAYQEQPVRPVLREYDSLPPALTPKKPAPTQSVSSTEQAK